MTRQQPERPQPSTRPMMVGIILVVIALVALFLWQSGSQDQGSAAPNPAGVVTQETAGDTAAGQSESEQSAPPDAPALTNDPVATETPLLADASEPPQQVSDLPPIPYEDLPPEAHDTIELIDEGGSFPYDKDGSTFQNREGILPDREMGYYSEYTVITPGSPDRGARRIVAGADGEMYYTDDHYSSFSEVIR